MLHHIFINLNINFLLILAIEFLYKKEEYLINHYYYFMINFSKIKNEPSLYYLIKIIKIIMIK